jgi:hypothetical protein
MVPTDFDAIQVLPQPVVLLRLVGAFYAHVAALALHRARSGRLLARDATATGDGILPAQEHVAGVARLKVSDTQLATHPTPSVVVKGDPAG